VPFGDGQPGLHLRDQGVGGGRAVGEADHWDGLVAAVDALDERRSLGVALDVHNAVVDPRLIHLQLEPAAVATPRRRVHRHHGVFNRR